LGDSRERRWRAWLWIRNSIVGGSGGWEERGKDWCGWDGEGLVVSKEEGKGRGSKVEIEELEERGTPSRGSLAAVEFFVDRSVSVAAPFSTTKAATSNAEEVDLVESWVDAERVGLEAGGGKTAGFRRSFSSTTSSMRASGRRTSIM
jgi:hypothetical protein